MAKLKHLTILSLWHAKPIYVIPIVMYLYRVVNIKTKILKIRRLTVLHPLISVIAEIKAN